MSITKHHFTVVGAGTVGVFRVCCLTQTDRSSFVDKATNRPRTDVTSVTR